MNLEKLEGLSKEVLDKIKKTIEDVEIDRFKKWLNTIEQNNENEFDRLLNLGINFPLVLKKDISYYGLEIRCLFDIKNIEDTSLLNKFMKVNSTELNKGDYHKCWIDNLNNIEAIIPKLRQTIKNQLTMRELKSEDVYINLIKMVNDREYLNIDDIKSIILKYSVHNDIKKAPKILELIEENKLETLCLKSIQKIEDFIYLIEEKNYKKHLLSLTDEEINNLMNEYTMNSKVEIFKYLHEELNLPLTTKKSGYSSLFARTGEEHSDFQRYIVSKIDDITANKHQIIRTVLHDELSSKTEFKLSLTKYILNRYSEEQLKEIPLIIKDRKDSVSVKYLKDYYESFTSFIDLKQDLIEHAKTIELPKNNIRRNKI